VTAGWLRRWYVCVHAVLHRGSNCSLARAMGGRVMPRSMISSCQSANSKVVKALLVTSLTHVSSAIASTRSLPLPISFEFTAPRVKDRQRHSKKKTVEFETKTIMP